MKTKNRWILYNVINECPNNKYDYYMDFMLWSKRKTKRHLNILLEDGLIQKENKKYRASTVKELMGY